MAKAPWLCWVGCGSKMGASSIAYGRWGDSVRQISARHFGRFFVKLKENRTTGGPIGVYTEHWNLGVWDEIGADRRDLTYFWWDPFDSPVLDFCHYQGVCVCMFNFKIIWRIFWLVKSWQTHPTLGEKRISTEGVALSKLPRGPPGPGCTHWVKAGMKLLILDVGACTTSHKQ